MQNRYFPFILCLVFYIFSITPAFAQIRKGSWIVDGFGQYQASKGDYLNFGTIFLESNSKSIGLDAEVGYFFTNKLALGGQIGFYGGVSYDKQTDSTRQPTLEQKRYSQYWRIKPYMRYYFTPNKPLKLYVELAVNPNFYTSKTKTTFLKKGVDSIYLDVEEFTLHTSATVGINYFIAPNVAFEGSFPYALSTYHYAKTNRRVGFSIDAFPRFRLEPQIKMKLFLNTKKQSKAILAEHYLKKNNWTVGVNGYVSSFYTVSLSPSIGYFIENRLLAQVSVDLNSTVFGDNFWQIKPSIQLFQPLSKKLQIIGKIATYKSEKSFMFLSKLNTIYTQIGAIIDGGIGLNTFIADNLSLEATANVQYYPSSKYLNRNPNIQLGLQYFIARK